MIRQGHVLEVLRGMEAESVQMVCTSPPYWGLRDYGLPPQVWGGDAECEHEWGAAMVEHAAGYEAGSKVRWNHQANGRGEVQERFQDRAGWTRKEFGQGAFCQRCGAWSGSLGLEPDYWLYVGHMVDVFEEVRRVLRKDGVLWLNLGDCWHHPEAGCRPTNTGRNLNGPESHWPGQPTRLQQARLKPKDLVGIPWRVAFALQDVGWWLRSDIIWHKPNAMPESVTDRPTKAHEYLFLLAKSERYYYDAEAIKEPASSNTHLRIAQRTLDQQLGGPKQRAYEDGSAGRQLLERSAGQIAKGLAEKAGKQAAAAAAAATGFNERYFGTGSGVNPKAALNAVGSRQNESFSAAVAGPVLTVNKRSVWTIPTQPRPEAHFATFPDEIARPCILAGSRAGDVVLDPFAGSGTVGVVAKAFGREFVGIELNPEYLEMAERRIAAQNPPLPFEATA